MQDTAPPSPYGPNGTTLPTGQSRLDALMPRRAVKPRFLELSSKPARYTLTGIKAGYPKSVAGKDGGKGFDLDVLVVACLNDEHGVAHEWELTAKTAYRDLRAIVEAQPFADQEALLDLVGELPLELAVHGKGKETTYTVRRAS